MFVLSEKEKQVARILARQDFYFFVRYMFWVRRGYEWVHSPHHKKICDRLTDVYYGNTQNLIVNIPPRYGKTEIVVINFVAWSMGKMPDCEFIHSSYSATLASNNSSQIRDLICNEEYQKIFPNVALKDDSKAKDHWKTQAGGTMYATGAGGTITGFGAGKMRDGFGGAILIDDPHKATEARSETMRNNVINWFTETIKSRRNSQKTPIIVIMQRLHEEDLSGFLLSGQDDDEWEHLCLPAIDDDGNPLWEFKHNIEKLRQMEMASPYMFAGQYMQSPTPLDGGFFKVAQMQIVDTLPATATKHCRAWDLAGTADGGDYTAGVKIYDGGDGYFYVADVERGQWDTATVRQTVKLTADLDGKLCRIYLPQDGGQAGKDQAKSYVQMLAGYSVTVKSISGDKVTRAEPFSAQVNMGNVRLLKGDWNKAFIDELKLFPNGKNDDQVDAVADAFNHLFNFVVDAPVRAEPIPTVKNYWN